MTAIPQRMSDPDQQDERKLRPVAKSATAFRTISEVSAELGVPQHVLRFWETRFPQVKPLKRGGGRRYYRPEDVELLRRIQRLLYEEGYTIKGVQKLLRETRGLRGPGGDDTAPDLGLDMSDAGRADAGRAEDGAEGGDADAGDVGRADLGGADAGDDVDDADALADGEGDHTDWNLGVGAGAVARSPALPPVEAPAPVPEPPRLTPAQRGRIQTVLTELRALRELLKQTLD